KLSLQTGHNAEINAFHAARITTVHLHSSLSLSLSGLSRSLSLSLSLALSRSHSLIPPSLLLALSLSFSPIPCFLPIIDLQLIHLFYLAVLSPSFILPLFISPFPFSCILLFLLCACRFLSLSLSL